MSGAVLVRVNMPELPRCTQVSHHIVSANTKAVTVGLIG